MLGAMFLSVSRRYRAPREVGVLSDPPESEIAGLIEANRAALNVNSIHINGTPLIEFRRQAVSEILGVARAYMRECGEPVPDFADGPLLMSGHQPELTHVGVLVKTFALHGFALRHNLTPLNLIVDNDTVKTTALRLAVLPEGQRTPEGVHLLSLPYDRYDGEVVFEKRRILEPALFDSFAERARPATETWGFEPLLPEMWAEMRRQRARTPILGEIVSATRRAWERRWGCHNLEIPLSRMCETQAFRRFAHHVVADLPRFHAIYNECVAAYRTRNHVRSRNHPVPDLVQQGEVLEAPFWTMNPGEDRRARLMTRPGESFDGKSLRSRALTTTMFLRCILSDGFIHGIGGAKYDEVTDAILERWLGLTPPGFIVLTATLRLPLPTFPTTPENVHDAERAVRDASWNPQRWLPEFSSRMPEIHQLMEKKEGLINAEPTGKAERKEWFRQLAGVTMQLRPFVEQRLVESREKLTDLRREATANESLIRRDFAWCLFPEAVLKDFCQKLLAH